MSISLAFSRNTRVVLVVTLVVVAALLFVLKTVFSDQERAVGAPTRQSANEIIARGHIEPEGRVIAVNGPPGGTSTVAVVDKLLVDQGDKVEAGHVVAILNGFDVSQADLKVAEANLNLAKLQRVQVQAGRGRPAEIAAQKNVVAGRRAQLTRAQKDLDRTTELVKNHNASEQSLDMQQAAVEQAKSDVDQGENTLAALTEVRPVDDAVAEGQIVVAQANLAKAQTDTERLQIRAPIAGTVLSIQARASEAIQSDGILRMGDLDHLIVVAEVDEGQIGHVTKGMAARIEGEMLPQPVQGSVTRVAYEVFRQKRPSSDILTGRDAKIVEVEVTPQSPLPPVVGGELVVYIVLPSAAQK
jgi:HlyD family secretion protein